MKIKQRWEWGRYKDAEKERIEELRTKIKEVLREPKQEIIDEIEGQLELEEWEEEFIKVYNYPIEAQEEYIDAYIWYINTKTLTTKTDITNKGTIKTDTTEVRTISGKYSLKSSLVVRAIEHARKVIDEKGWEYNKWIEDSIKMKGTLIIADDRDSNGSVPIEVIEKNNADVFEELYYNAYPDYFSVMMEMGWEKKEIPVDPMELPKGFKEAIDRVTVRKALAKNAEIFRSNKKDDRELALELLSKRDVTDVIYGGFKKKKGTGPIWLIEESGGTSGGSGQLHLQTPLHSQNQQDDHQNENLGIEIPESTTDDLEARSSGTEGGDLIKGHVESMEKRKGNENGNGKGQIPKEA